MSHFQVTVWRGELPADVLAELADLIRPAAAAVSNVVQFGYRRRRPCLVCDVSFESAGAHNVVCWPCRMKIGICGIERDNHESN